MLLRHGPAVGLHDTDGHGHQDGADIGGNAADGDLEDDEKLVGDAPHGHQHTGAEALELPDQLRTGLFQAVALQCAGQDHQDDGDQLGAVGDKGAAHGLQQLARWDLAAHGGDDSGNEDDRDRLKLEGKANDHDQNAK